MGRANGDYSFLSSHIALMGERVWSDGGGVSRGSPVSWGFLGQWKESTGLGVSGGFSFLEHLWFLGLYSRIPCICQVISRKGQSLILKSVDKAFILWWFCRSNPGVLPWSGEGLKFDGWSKRKPGGISLSNFMYEEVMNDPRCRAGLEKRIPGRAHQNPRRCLVLRLKLTGDRELIFLFLSGPKTMILQRWKWGSDFRCEGRLQIGSWSFMLQEEVKEKTIGAFLSPQRSGGRNQPLREFLFPSGFPFLSPQFWDFF